MLNWAKKGLGLKDEIYGADALRSVALQTADTPYTVTTRDDHKWLTLEETHVETKTFYVFTEEGYVAMYQVVTSSLLGMKKTATVNTKIFTKDTRKVLHWDTDELKTWTFSEDKVDFSGDHSSMALNEKGTTYTLKTKNAKIDANLTFTQSTDGVKLGRDGATTYLGNPAQPARMVHHFWPRCKVEGSMTTEKGETINLNGVGMFAYALQGMKPHFAAAKWNFACFAGPTHSAILMEFTTPASYADTTVSVGVVAKDGEIVTTGTSPTTKCAHTSSKLDKNKIPEPTAIALEIAGASGPKATLETPLGTGMDVIDIMGELPAMVRQIAISASGTKPYIFQYGPDATLNLTGAGDAVQEQGRLFMEATFIARV